MPSGDRSVPLGIRDTEGRTTVQHRFELHRVDLEAAFALFSDPARLNDVTPEWFSLIVRGPHPWPLRRGARIDYRFHWRGLPLPWRSIITEYHPPCSLVYRQERGPFRYFQHEHYFEAVDAGVLITDRIVYRVLGGPWVERYLVQPDLQRILRYREAASRRLLEAAV